MTMTSSWQVKDGHIACRWSGLTERVKYESSCMQPDADIQGSYLPPMPDFAGHSPFGGPYSFWFLPEHCRHPEQ
jgi:hypothetical protein